MMLYKFDLKYATYYFPSLTQQSDSATHNAVNDQNKLKQKSKDATMKEIRWDFCIFLICITLDSHIFPG